MMHFSTWRLMLSGTFSLSNAFQNTNYMIVQFDEQLFSAVVY